MRLLFDMDDTLVDLHGPWVRSVNNKMGWDIHKWDLTTWDRKPEEVWQSILRIPGFFEALDWVQGARQAMIDIPERHDIYIVSSPAVWEACKGKYHWTWAKMRVPNIIPSMDRLVLTRSKHIIQGDVLIDDNWDNLEKWLDAHPYGAGIVYTQPWNMRDENLSFKHRERIWRMLEWTELPGILDKIEAAIQSWDRVGG